MRLSLQHVLCSLAVAGLGLTVCLAQPAATTTAPASSGQDAAPAVDLVKGAHTVKLAKADGKWQLTRDGQPYFIKGVGGDGSRDTLLANGGNSIRIWGIDSKTTPAELNDDAKKGISVALGFWVEHKEKGFNYEDPVAVKNQLEEFKRVINIYRDSPALLVWAIGNEMENGNDTPALWGAIEGLAKAAHELDPNHPTMTVIAEVGGSKVANIHKFCPDVDIVGINSYAGGPSVGKRYLDQAGAEPKPYVITEFGPPGQWEFWEKSSFGVLKELNSTDKAEKWYRKTYTDTVLGHPNECLGSYSFLWGNKVEMTSTWYGMFLADGSKTGAVDVMQELWSGKKTDAPAPVLKKMSVVGSDAAKAGGTVKAKLDATDPNGGTLKYDWKLLHELANSNTQEPGAQPGAEVPDAVEKNGEAEASFKMPKYNGIYRIYGYVRNEKGGAAVCSLPVKVTGGEDPPKETPKTKP